MHLHRMVIDWSGGSIVGRSVTVLHFDGSSLPAPPVATVKAAFSAAAAIIPGNVTLTFPNSGDTIEDTTGALTGVWSGSGGGTVAGSAPAAQAAGVGACTTWSTGGIVNGRKLRGRTFFVPLAAGGYDSDGTFLTSTYGVLTTLANAIMASGGLAVWHRPTIPGGADGTSYGVLSNRVRDKVAFLSSRRD
jgi:hypothetical protein